MPFCINVPEPTNCCLDLWFDDKSLCFECGKTMPSDPKIAKDFEWGIYFGASILFIVGIWNVLSFIRVYKNNNNYISIIRLSNILYAFGTGIFAICRVYFQFGKPLLVLAAIHNLSEWIFVNYAFYKNKKQREKMIFLSMIWILIIIGIVIIVIPQYIGGSFVEQITGISLDFMLPIIWFIIWRQNKNKNNKIFADIYFIAFITHLIHLLFTILPLIVQNVIGDQNETLSRLFEFVILLSVPSTHILYTKFVNLFEEYIDLPSIKKEQEEEEEKDYDDIIVVQKPSFIHVPVIKMLFWYILCIVIGLFPTTIIPLLLPKCDAGNDDIGTTTTTKKFEDDFIIGTTKIKIYPGMEDAFEYYVMSHNLIENARNFDGNIFFYFNKDSNNQNTYYFVEGWKSKQAVQKWIASDYDKSVFNDYIFAMFETQPEMNSYTPFRQNYNPVTSENIGKAATRNVYSGFNGCHDIGEDALKLGDCGFIYGCDHMEVISKEKREQIMVMDDGQRYHCFFIEPKKEIYQDRIEYGIIHKCNTGITEHFQFISYLNNFPSDECHITAKLDIDLNIHTVDEIVGLFSSKSREFIKNKYEIDPAALKIPDNEISRKLLSAKTAIDFFNVVIQVQENITQQALYVNVSPYFYTIDGKLIYNDNVFRGYDEIKALYDSFVSDNNHQMHSFLMDPVIETIMNNNNNNNTLITVPSNIVYKGTIGCDYTTPMTLSLELTNTCPIKIEKVVYNTPTYSLIEQNKVLTNCSYLSVIEREKLINEKNNNLQSVLYEIWDGFRIINDNKFGELWKPYLAINCSLWFDNMEYFGIKNVIKFHNNLGMNIFGGYRFYIISLIANNNIITIHLRGDVMSFNFKQIYNDNFRMIIEYKLNENDDISLINYHIDSIQLQDLKRQFNILQITN